MPMISRSMMLILSITLSLKAFATSPLFKLPDEAMALVMSYADLDPWSYNGAFIIRILDLWRWPGATGGFGHKPVDRRAQVAYFNEEGRLGYLANVLRHEARITLKYSWLAGIQVQPRLDGLVGLQPLIEQATRLNPAFLLASLSVSPRSIGSEFLIFYKSDEISA